MIEADRPVAPTAQVGVDVGGTFTDAALVHDGRLITAKVPTTPHDQPRRVWPRRMCVGSRTV
jgi:N-methylhydantoinase A